MTPSAPTPANPSDRWQLAAFLLVVAYLMLGFIYCVIQPPTAPPDETANLQYIRFLVDQRRLPHWEENGGGEGGYEAQHPPLTYLIEAVPYAASEGAGESYRWLAARLTVLVIGLALFAVLPPLARRLFPRDPLAAFALTATVVLMPHSLMYLTFANPDAFCLLLAAAALLVAVRIYSDAAEHPLLPWVAGLLSAVASLVKLTVAPILFLFLLAQWLRPDQKAAERWQKVCIISGVWLAGGAWWYVRNLVLYGKPFIHTKATMGPGLEYAALNGGPLRVAAVGASETYLSIWAQRGWFPAGTGESVLYCLVTLFVLLAGVGFFLRRRRSTSSPQAPDTALRFATAASVVILTFTLVSQQIAYLFVDAGWNAGGRYLLTALPEIAVLLVLGLRSLVPPALARAALGGWVALLVVMNLISANTIISALVPRDYPGWQMFDFPRQASPPDGAAAP
ncbi:MAG: hypothetical protein H7Z41_03945 [Cytophagales bacterium]|nr:hypothetical protein [Armatimonadota bacterium]